MSWQRIIAWTVALLMVFGACTSNPTPHPGHEGEPNDYTDGQTAEDNGPDRDGDGVPDCQQAGGVWQSGVCQGASLDGDITTVPGGDVGDAITGGDTNTTTSDTDTGDDVVDPSDASEDVGSDVPSD